MISVDLSAFDPHIIAAYHITEQDLQNAVRYITILQGQESQVLVDLANGCYYGTSVLLHEVVELHILLIRNPRLLQGSKKDIGLYLKANSDAHEQALIAEYSYLQERLDYILGEVIGIGALVRANASSEDFNILFKSDFEVPILEPTPEQIAHAAKSIARLKTLGRESCK